MANELVKELEEAEGILATELAETYVDGTALIQLHCVEAEKIQSTLQRAREALTWIPVSERLPEKSGLFAVSGRDMVGKQVVETEIEFDADTGVFDTFLEVEAWKNEVLPYIAE